MSGFDEREYNTVVLAALLHDVQWPRVPSLKLNQTATMLLKLIGPSSIIIQLGVQNG